MIEAISVGINQLGNQGEQKFCEECYKQKKKPNINISISTRKWLQDKEINYKEYKHFCSLVLTLVELSPTEYKLLRFLMSNPNRVLTKAQILDHVWEYDFNGEMGIVESYVSYLRKKLDPLTTEPLIQTKRGVGYMYKSVKNGK